MADSKVDFTIKAKQEVAASRQGLQYTQYMNSQDMSLFSADQLSSANGTNSIFSGGNTYGGNYAGLDLVNTNALYTSNNRFTNPAYCTNSGDAMCNYIGMTSANLVNHWNQQIKAALQNGQTQAANGQNGATGTNVTNGADVFKNITADNVAEMKQKEEEIEAAQDKLTKAEEEAKKTPDDKEKQKAAADAKAKLEELQKAYNELDEKYGNGKSLSSKYGNKYSFYKNLSTDELAEIDSANGKIDSMKAELERIEKELEKTQKQHNDTIQEGLKKNDKTAAEFETLYNQGKCEEARNLYLAKDDVEYVQKLEKQRDEQRKAISTEIDTLSAYIKKAGADENTVKYTEHKAAEEKKEAEAKAEAKKQTANDVAGIIGESLYDADGKTAKAATDIEKAVKEKFKDKSDDEKPSDATIKQVAQTLAGMTNGKTKAEFEAYLNTDEFFKTVANATYTGEKDQAKENLKLLMATYDSIKGEDAFEKYVNDDNHLTGGATVQKSALTDAIKALKPAAPAPAAPEVKPKADEVKEEDSPDKDGSPKSNDDIKKAIENGNLKDITAEHLVQYFSDKKSYKTGDLDDTQVVNSAVINKLLIEKKYQTIISIIDKLNSDASEKGLATRVCGSNRKWYAPWKSISCKELKENDSDFEIKKDNDTYAAEICKDYASEENLARAIYEMAQAIKNKQNN